MTSSYSLRKNFANLVDDHAEVKEADITLSANDDSVTGQYSGSINRLLS